MKRIVLELDDADYDAVQEAIAKRQAFGNWPDPISIQEKFEKEDVYEYNPKSDGSNIAGLAIAEICRGWVEMMQM